MKEAMNLLGLKARDLVTGFEGVVTTVAFDLYGCIQAVVTPPVKDGKREDGQWFDTKRLEITDATPVMLVSNFNFANVPGGAEKSLPERY